MKWPSESYKPVCWLSLMLLQPNFYAIQQADSRGHIKLISTTILCIFTNKPKTELRMREDFLPLEQSLLGGVPFLTSYGSQ